MHYTSAQESCTADHPTKHVSDAQALFHQQHELQLPQLMHNTQTHCQGIAHCGCAVKGWSILPTSVAGQSVYVNAGADAVMLTC